MKKMFTSLVLVTSVNLAALNLTAQNVGIGTPTPTENLEIKNPLKSTVKISASSYLDTTQLIFSNKSSNAGFYTNFLIKSVGESGLFFSSQSDLPANNSANALVIRPGGNVGIGNSIPAYKLDVIGDINTTGLLRINGATGAAGQVLSSNGTLNPKWVNAGLTHYVGELFGGGIIVAVWKIAGVEHGLIASSTNLSTDAAWSNVTAPAAGTDEYNGQANTTAIISQPGHTNSAAKLCNDFSSGGFADWYLPAAWELYQCFSVAHIVNTITGAANAFRFGSGYWSSTEQDITFSFGQSYGRTFDGHKNTRLAVRAVRKF